MADAANRSTMRVPQPDIIEHFGNADAVPQLPERCLSRKAGIVRCCLSIRRVLRPQARFGGPLDGQCPSVCKANPLVQLQNPLGFALLAITFS